MSLWILPLLTFIILTVIIAVIWLFYDHGANRLKQPEEWQSTGSSGEQIIFLTLNKKLHIPENQILRNVYIPTENGKTSEIDLLVVSKKGLFVFEVKNYAGNIYGDTKRKKWIQYLGKKKSFFYNIRILRCSSFCSDSMCDMISLAFIQFLLVVIPAGRQ